MLRWALESDRTPAERQQIGVKTREKIIIRRVIAASRRRQEDTESRLHLYNNKRDIIMRSLTLAPLLSGSVEMVDDDIRRLTCDLRKEILHTLSAEELFMMIEEL